MLDTVLAVAIPAFALGLWDLGRRYMNTRGTDLRELRVYLEKREKVQEQALVNFVKEVRDLVGSVATRATTAEHTLMTSNLRPGRR